jgi:hypothetical protein
MATSPKTQKAPAKPAKAAAKTDKPKRVRKRPQKLVIPDEVKGKPNRVGRPTSYKEEFSELAFKFCLLGATDVKLAEFFLVNVDTIYEWKRSVPEFSEALKRGREIADANVANSLYHRALGYSHPEDDIRTLSVGLGRSEIVITPTIKHYPPDTGAAALWLKNRRPDLWRDRVENVHQNPDGSPVDFSLKVQFVNPSK